MLSPLTEGKSMTFSRVSSTGKEMSTKVRIDKEIRIGGGVFGKVYESQVTIGNRPQTFVIKRFRSYAGFTPEENADEAIRNYQVAKQAGLRVFPTYRLGEDKQSILMTNGNTQDSVCIGIGEDSSNIEDLLGTKIEEIADKDLHLLVDGVFSQAIRAGEHSIYLPADAFFFLVDKKTKSKVNFVIGDCDALRQSCTNACFPTIRRNLEHARGIVALFLNNNVKVPGEYTIRVEKIYEEALSQQLLKYGEN